MAWYNTGTIALTNGSATVTGSGTNFLVGAQIGEALYAPDGKLYEIQTINSATVITLASNYLGSTASGQGYQIIPTQSLVADLASDVTDLISDFADVRDYAGNGKFNDGAVGTPGITFTQDQDNGLYRIGSNNWALAAGGQKIVDISTSGIDVTGTVTADTGEITRLGLGAAAHASAALLIDTTDQHMRLTNGSELGVIELDSSGHLNIWAHDDGETINLKTGSGAGNNVLSVVGNNVGIGTTSPAAPLSFGSLTNDARIYLRGNTNEFAIGTNGSQTVYAGYAGHIFQTGSFGGAERMRIDASGNVGIGTNPSDPLTVLGSAGTIASFTNGADTDLLIKAQSAVTTLTPTTGILALGTSNTEHMRIDSSGNLLVGTSSSSGDTANSKPVVAGNFTTKYGVSSIPSVNTWTTVHTFGSNQGNFMVSMRASGTGNIADNSVSIVAINGSATTHTSLLSGANVTIRIVGLTLQVYQNVFAGANISWSIMSIGN